jgi:hypothetical protein
MLKGNFMRRVRGAIGNAIVWGGCWAALTVVTLSTLKLVGAFGQELIWLDIIGMAIKVGIFGGVASGAFSFLLPLFYRRKRLSDINWVKFGIMGGVVTGLFVPLFMQSMNILSGSGPIAWNLIDTDILLGAVFGAVTGGGSLWLAQRAERRLPGGGNAHADALSSNIGSYEELPAANDIGFDVPERAADKVKERH